MQEHPLYSLSDKVVDGIKRGRKIGFPTANLDYTDQESKELPFGVYAVKIIIKGKTFIGVANVGVPLTFHEELPRIDVHILNFSEDIYTQKITVEFWKKLRDIVRFRDEQHLIWQIEEDIKETRDLFKHETRE